MEDEASILLDGKTISNLRVVDLKQELEKRGLSKSGSKKDLVKRLKVQLEFEKLCGERKSAADCDLKLDLDADTEQNEFVQQYLAQQQKIYAEQKEVKRRIELEETLKGTDKIEDCDSTKCEDDATIVEDDNQTEPDEPEEEDSMAKITNQKIQEDTKLGLVNSEIETASTEVQDVTFQPTNVETANLELQHDADEDTSHLSKVESKISENEDVINQETPMSPNIDSNNVNKQDDIVQKNFQPSKVESEGLKVQNDAVMEASKHLKAELKSLEVQGDVNQEIFKPSEANSECPEAQNFVDQEIYIAPKIETATEIKIIDKQETTQNIKITTANSKVQYVADVQKTLSTVSIPEKELVKDITCTEIRDCKNQIISSNIQASVNSSSENIKRLDTISYQGEETESPEIIQEEHVEFNTETIQKKSQQDASSEVTETLTDSSGENTQEKSKEDATSKVMEAVTDSRETVSPKSEPLFEMEPTTQFSTVPYSLMDIQLPESPGTVKSKSASDSVESDSVNNTEETHSNGIDSTDIKSTKRDREKDSKDDYSEKVCSPDNNSDHEKSEELTQQTKESSSDDSKILESRSESKKGSDLKNSTSKELLSNRKIQKSKDSMPTRKDSRSKSRETKRTRRSSEDSSSHRHSKSRSRERALKKFKEDPRSHKNSRSRSKEKDKRTRKYEKDSDTRKVSHSRRDSRSRSKESSRKTRKTNIDSKTRKAAHSRRKSRSTSSDSKSNHSSDSDDEIQKRKEKSKGTKQKLRDQKKRSDSESDESSSSSSDSPSQNSKQKGYSARQKNKHHKRESSNGTQSSRSRSPAKKKSIRRSEDCSESAVTSKHGKCKNKDDNQNTRSRSRDKSPIQKKTKSKSVEKSDKQKETINKEEILDINKVGKSLGHEDSLNKKKSKNNSVQPHTLPVDGNEKIEEQMHKNTENEDSKSKSRESSPVNNVLKNKSYDQEQDSTNLVKTSKRNKSSRSRSREKSPLQSKLKHKSESHTDIKKTRLSQEELKSRSREHSPIESKPIGPPSDSEGASKSNKHKKESKIGITDDNQTSRNQESTPIQTTKESTDESSVDSAALTERARQESQSSVEDQDSRSLSGEKSPDPKKSKISIEKSKVDFLDVPKHQTEPSDTAPSINDIPGAVKKGNILIVKKEPIKLKLKIKRDNVISCQTKIETKENKSEKSEMSESSEENQKEPANNPVRAQYVSRKIILSNRSRSVTSDDEPKSKSKWGNLASSQKASAAINISTDSLKNWFPDFKLLKDPTPEEPVSLVKEESDMEISVDKHDEDSKHVSSTQKIQEPEQEVNMEVDSEEKGPVSKILFIQNLVRPFTLNQLKELLKETGSFIEDEFWIDKIKSKCFVTYVTEEAAVKTRNHLNGTRWPSSNPKILSVEFSNEEELEIHRSGNDAPKTVVQPVSEPNEARESRASHSFDDFRKKDHDLDRKRDRAKQQAPVREWDKDKITQESPDREHSGKNTDKSKYLDKKEKKDSKRRANEDTPAKLLDDLFQKTKSSPCIYWLPLTDEQVQERVEAKRLKRQEREKRNQQREQEDAENKSKRPRSRNRTRDVETRRSSTRSRSPVTRRR